MNSLRKMKHGHTRHALKGKRTRTYISWDAMIQRCTNPKNGAYHYYGGKGVRVCDKWLTFAGFLEDMGPVPKGMSLDRFPHTAMVYSKSSCRWATKLQQVLNRGLNKNNTSGYRGVSWGNTRKNWRARIMAERKEKHLGCFSNKHDAARAYNKAAIGLWGDDATLNEVTDDKSRSI